MLGLFANKPDHPLADPREVRRVLSDLAGREPSAAIEETSAWLESIAAAEDFRLDLRLELILQLDEAAHPHARRLGRDYLTSPRLGRAQEFRLWLANRNYWAQLAHAYERCQAQHDAHAKGADAVRASLPLFQARLINAYAALLKWDQFRYGPMDTTLWASCGKVYLAADRAKLAQKRFPLYAGTPETSVEAEYLKALLFSASSMDSLLPLEIEVAERLIAHFLPHFVLTAEARPDNVYWVDAAKPVPPTRLAKLPEIAPTLRFFSAGRALAAVEELRRHIEETGDVPSSVNLGGQYSPRIIVPVLEHLASYWAPKPPMRAHRRHHVKSRLAVIHSLQSIHQRLSGDDGAEGAEAWVAEDVSQGGMGANVPLGANDWIRIGTLVGMQAEGGDNWLVGVIRRFSRETPVQGSVGIETLSKSPLAVVGDSGGLRAEALLLDDITRPGDEVRLALSPAAWDDNVPVTITVDGRSVRLQPIVIAESGVDFVLGRYSVLSGR